MSYSREEIEDAGLLDFRLFLLNTWDFLNLPSPTEVQYDVAEYLQHGPRRLVIQGFRGMGKSWITAAFVLWTLLLDHEKKVLVVSASQGLADDFSRFCKSLILGMPLLQHLAPRSDQRFSNVSFDVGPSTPSKDPSVKSVGISGQLTGSRADLIIPDDVEVVRNSYTHGMREKLSELVKEFDAVIKPDGRIAYLGTPQVEQSLYTKLQKRGYELRIWPSEIPPKLDRYAGRLAPVVYSKMKAGLVAGDPLDPIRFSREDLRERKISYGATGYALQFLLDTTPSEADKYPLKCKDLVIHDCDPEMSHVKLVWGSDEPMNKLESVGFDGDFYVKPTWKSEEMAPYSGTVMAIDPSAKGKDETAYAIVRSAHGLLYLVASGGYKDGFAEDTLTDLAGLMATHRVSKYIIERNYGGGMFDELLKPHVRKIAKAQKDEDWNSWSIGKKEWRILDTLEPIIQSHKLVIDRRVIERDLAQARDNEAYSLIWQLTRMARVAGCLPHDDRLESLGMACGYWRDFLSRDSDTELKRHKERLFDDELQKFLDNIPGARNHGPRWTSTIHTRR